MLYTDKPLKVLLLLEMALSIADGFSYNNKIDILILLGDLIKLL